MQRLRTKYLLQPLLRWNPRRLLMGLKVANGPGVTFLISAEKVTSLRGLFWLRPLSGRCLHSSSWGALGRMDLHPETDQSWRLHGKTQHIKRHKLCKDGLVPSRRRGFFKWNSEVIHLTGLWSLLKVLSPNKLLKHLVVGYFRKWSRCFSWPVAICFMVNRCILLRHPGHTENCVFSLEAECRSRDGAETCCTGWGIEIKLLIWGFNCIFHFWSIKTYIKKKAHLSHGTSAKTLELSETVCSRRHCGWYTPIELHSVHRLELSPFVKVQKRQRASIDKVLSREPQIWLSYPFNGASALRGVGEVFVGGVAGVFFPRQKPK